VKLGGGISGFEGYQKVSVSGKKRIFVFGTLLSDERLFVKSIVSMVELEAEIGQGRPGGREPKSNVYRTSLLIRQMALVVLLSLLR
jgi:hypothetical protein